VTIFDGGKTRMIGLPYGCHINIDWKKIQKRATKLVLKVLRNYVMKTG